MLAVYIMVVYVIATLFCKGAKVGAAAKIRSPSVTLSRGATVRVFCAKKRGASCFGGRDGCSLSSVRGSSSLVTHVAMAGSHRVDLQSAGAVMGVRRVCGSGSTGLSMNSYVCVVRPMSFIENRRFCAGK